MVKAIFDHRGVLNLLLDSTDWVLNGNWQAEIDRSNKLIKVVETGKIIPYAWEIEYQQLWADIGFQKLSKIIQSRNKKIKTIKVY
jgi:hypothetical protein